MPIEYLYTVQECWRHSLVVVAVAVVIRWVQLANHSHKVGEEDKSF